MNNAGKVLVGFISGLTVGAVAGILLAPDKGENTRKNITDRTNKIKDGIGSTVQKGVDKFNSLTESAFTLVNNYSSEVKDKTNQN